MTDIDEQLKRADVATVNVFGAQNYPLQNTIIDLVAAIRELQAANKSEYHRGFVAAKKAVSDCIQYSRLSNLNLTRNYCNYYEVELLKNALLAIGLKNKPE